jgi:arylsulfatase A-like enzyme
MPTLLFHPRLFVLVTILVLCQVTTGFAEPAANTVQQKPNLVIMILDDWGYGDSGAYGNLQVQTPNIDQLARDGIQFNQAFLTASTCTSSRASILTGLYPFATGAPRLGTEVPGDRRLVSSYLHDAGYFTASIGKWHLGSNVMGQFDLVSAEKPGIPYEQQNGMEDWMPTLEHKLPPDRPFFLWLASHDPHRPWPDVAQWDPEKITALHIPAYIEINKTHPPAFVRSELAQYYAAIERADAYIGNVMLALDHQHRLDNTVIIVMSDNGPPFWKAKKFLTDPGLKTPFIVYWPGKITHHKEVNALMSAVDIAPTLLDLAGVAIPPGMEGKSFAAWLNDKPDANQINEFVYGERGDGVQGSENGRSIRDQHYLYIMDDYPTYTDCDDKTKLDYMRGEQLYDVVQDPDSLHSLVEHRNGLGRLWHSLKGEKDYSATVLHYRQLLAERRKARNDLPQPVIKGACPPMWWNKEPDEKNNASPAND